MFQHNTNAKENGQININFASEHMLWKRVVRKPAQIARNRPGVEHIDHENLYLYQSEHGKVMQGLELLA